MTGQQAPSPVPQFRSGIELTRLEVTVLDKRTRRPIRGLTADDFVVKVGGRQQVVVAVNEVERAKSLTGNPTLVEGAQDVTSNEVRPERLFVIILDDSTGSNDPFERKMGLQVANRIVDLMDPRTDMGAVVFSRNNRHAQDFTRDRSLLRQAIAKFIPIPTAETRVLERTLQFLQGVAGFRRAIFFVSAGQAGAATRALRSTLDNSLSGAQSARGLGGDVTLGALSAQGLAHVPVHMFSTFGLKAPTPADLVEGRLSSLFGGGTADAYRATARATGGRAVVDNNLPVAEVASVFEEMSNYYVIGYRHDYPTDRSLRWLQVDVKRSDVLVMPSDTAFETADTRALEGASVAPSMGRESGLLEVLGSAVAVGSLPLRLGLVPFTGLSQLSETVVTLGLPPSDSSGVSTFRVSTLIFDGEGRKQLQRIDRDVTVPASGDAEVAFPIALAPGRYSVRVAVEQVNGESGSVHATVVVPDTQRDALSMTGVAIGRTESAAIGGRESLAHLLPFAPTAVRTFAQSDRVGSLLRVHRGRRGTGAPILLTTEIVNDGGAMVFSATRSIDEAAAIGGADHRFELPLKRLKPGDYLLRFVATAGKARVQRDVRFAIAIK